MLFESVFDDVEFFAEEFDVVVDFDGSLVTDHGLDPGGVLAVDFCEMEFSFFGEVGDEICEDEG